MKGKDKTKQVLLGEATAAKSLLSFGVSPNHAVVEEAKVQQWVTWKAESECMGHGMRYSGIDLDTMKSLMHTFGPERSTFRHESKQTSDASLRRKFRRWFPNFFQYFFFEVKTGQWLARLGAEEEGKRRAFLRRMSQTQKREARNMAKGTTRTQAPSATRNRSPPRGVASMPSTEVSEIEKKKAGEKRFLHALEQWIENAMKKERVVRDEKKRNREEQPVKRKRKGPR
jgi:hypothetical protein